MSEPKRVKITQPVPGTALYRHPGNGAAVFCIHFTADAAKRDPEWERRERMLYPDQSDFETEYSIDFDADSGLRIYWAFEPSRNVVPAFDIPDDWTLSLAFDFGKTTAVMCLAQNPRTYEMVVFDEVYVTETGTEEVARMVYEKVAAARGISDAHRFPLNDILEDAVGDPTAPMTAVEYGLGSYPIIIRTKGFKTQWRLNDHKSGEEKVNQKLRPSFACCGVNWYPPKGSVEGQCGECAKLGKFVTRKARPMLTIMEGKAPNLVRTLPLIMRASKSLAGGETPEGEAPNQEDHAADALRYGIARATFEIPRESQARDYANEPSAGMQPHELLEKYRLRLALAQQAQAEMDSDDEAVVVGGIIDEYDELDEEVPDVLNIS